MAETKTGKYIRTGVTVPSNHPEVTSPILSLKSDEDYGNRKFSMGWEPITEPFLMLKEHHKHDFDQFLCFLGGDPNNMLDLGGEVEMYMGPEMEKHIITRSTLVYIPANFVHAPWVIRKVTRPWIFITVCQEPTHTEKSFKEMVPEEERGKLLFVDQGYDGKEAVIVQPQVIRHEEK